MWIPTSNVEKHVDGSSLEICTENNLAAQVLCLCIQTIHKASIDNMTQILGTHDRGGRPELVLADGPWAEPWMRRVRTCDSSAGLRPAGHQECD